MTIISGLGIVLAVALVIILSYKGVSSLIGGPIAALIILLTGGFDFTYFSSTYASAYGTSVAGLLLLYFASITLSEIMLKAGMIDSIAYWIADVFGLKHIPLICIVAVGLLSFGGLGNAAYITMYWIGITLCAKANINRNHIAAACMSAAWGFANVIPYAANNANGVLNNFLGTGADAGAIPGLAVGIAQLLLMIFYLEWVNKKVIKEEKQFDSWDILPEAANKESSDMLSPLVSVLPIVLVLVLYNVVKMQMILAMFLSCILATVLGLKQLKKAWFKAWQDGFDQAVQPIVKTAAMAAIGTCIAATPAFQALLEAAGAANMSPYVMCMLITMIVGACLGTAGGAVNTGVSALLPSIEGWVAAGYDIGMIHRMIAIGSMGLSALPHAGGINSCLAIYKTTFKDAYRHIFVTVVVIPTVTALAIGLPLALMFG